MIVLNVQQGSDDWLQARANCFTASEAPAMMGASKFKSRTDLLKEKKTGYIPEIDSMTQRRFDNGHKAEAAARPVIENIIGEELYPTTGVIEVDGMSLLASYDGITMLEDVVWENKLLNANLESVLTNGQELDPHYYWQLEHQLLVAGANKVIFSAGNIDGSNVLHMEYISVPERRSQLISGWKQFQIDMESFTPEAKSEEHEGTAPETLPALRIELTGMVTASNLEAWKSTAMTVIESVNTDLQTDVDFADAEKAVKWCKDVESRLDAAKQHALAQTASIDELFRAIDSIKEEARQKRLNLEKLVKTRKESIRFDLINAAAKEIDEYIAKLNQRIGGLYLANQNSSVRNAFATAIKGKKTVDSCKDALSVELANQKIFANDLADKIEVNLKSLVGDDFDWRSLFFDINAVCTKEPDDFKALLAMRIQLHKEQSAKEEERKAQHKAQAEQHIEQHSQPVTPHAQPVIEQRKPVESQINLKSKVADYLSTVELAPRTRSTVEKHLLAFVDYIA